MKKLIVKKIIRLTLVMLVMSLAVFICIRVMPGDPIDTLYGDKNLSQETKTHIMKIYHLDQPVWKQYLIYMVGVFRGDLGYSYYSVGTPVSEMIARGFGITFQLAIAALPCVAIAGILLGILAAVYENRKPDKLITWMAAFLTAIPSVPLAVFLVYIFAVKLKLLPIAGWGRADQMVLPVLFIVIWPAFNLAKNVRSLLVDEWQKNYVFLCRARGMGKFRIMLCECFPNVFPVVATQIGMMFGSLLEGALITELIFNIPGLGRCSIDAIFRRDYPVIMAVVLLSTLIYTLLNYLMEILQICLDPRIREGELHD